ncbi:MAG: hypothetical protein ETSY1_27250 [Candidatus Entotheonella factor]|uniref:Uncharacterized protein n=1 Tax=Entotheonella factor TaxID=1429438 RepID=W4LDX8_ENTF1|nr:hypothetical protein [Candidatus Entotheonella palauensis]ETW96273.1 MAG: hypothetical protein ETSY1_27250 [Candidatus Entotheonella factor]
MAAQAVTLHLPETLYIRLQQHAQATHQSFDEIALRAIQAGAPPSWEDAPREFQADLATLDRLDDDALWRIARSEQTETEMTRYSDLLEANANDRLSDDDQAELAQLRVQADRFMLRKVHAAALLRWRGHHIPPADSL